MVPQQQFQELIKQFTDNKINQEQLSQYFSSLTIQTPYHDFPYTELLKVKQQLLVVTVKSIQLKKDVAQALKTLLSEFKISYFYAKQAAEKNNHADLINLFKKHEDKLPYRDLITILVDINNSEDEKKYYLSLLEVRLQKNKKEFNTQLRGINDNMLIGLLTIVAASDKSEILKLILDVIPKKRIEAYSFDFETKEEIQYEIPKKEPPLDATEIKQLDFQGFAVAKNAVACVQTMLQYDFSFNQTNNNFLPPFTIALMFKRDDIVNLISNARKLKIPKDAANYIAHNYLVIASLIYPERQLKELLLKQPHLKDIFSEAALHYIISMTSVENIALLIPFKTFSTEKEFSYLLHAVRKVIQEACYQDKERVLNFVSQLFEKFKPNSKEFGKARENLDKNYEILTEVMQMCVYLINILSEDKTKETHKILMKIPNSTMVLQNTGFASNIEKLNEDKVRNNNVDLNINQNENSNKPVPTLCTFTKPEEEIVLYKKLLTSLYYASDKSLLTKELELDRVRSNIFTMALLANMDELVKDMVVVRNVQVENMHVMLFCRQGRDNLLKHVLEHQEGFNLFDFSSEGYTALDYAVLNNQIVCVDSILQFLLKDEKNTAYGDLDKYIQRAFKLATDKQTEIKALLLARLTNDAAKAKTEKKSSYNLVLQQLEQQTVNNNQSNTVDFDFKDKAGRTCIAHISADQYPQLQTKKGNVFDKVFAFIKDYGIFGYRMKEVRLDDGKMSYKIRPTGVFGNTRIHLIEKNVDENGVIHYDSYLKQHDTKKVIQPK